MFRLLVTACQCWCPHLRGWRAQVQMTLTPVPLPAPHGRKAPAAGGPTGMLMPLLAGDADSFSRLRLLLQAMAGDLVSRVLLDRCVS